MLIYVYMTYANQFLFEALKGASGSQSPLSMKLRKSWFIQSTLSHGTFSRK